MKAIVNTGSNRLEWQERPLPEPGMGQVRIKTVACGICAIDLEMIKGWSRTPFPGIPGHEWVGIVDATGDLMNAALVGQPCVAENVLSDGGEVGFEHPGGYAEYFLTETRNIQALPGWFPLRKAVLIEPLAVCVRGLRRLRLENKDAALVLGDGPIGLLTILLLKRVGVRDICLVGGRPDRLVLGAEFGASHVLNYHDFSGDVTHAIRRVISRPFPNIVECSGSAASMEAALQIADQGGKVLVIGDYGDDYARFRWNHLLHRELEIIGSNASSQAWTEAVQLTQALHDAMGRLITHQLPASQFAAAVDLVRTDRKAIKVILWWNQEQAVQHHELRGPIGIIHGKPLDDNRDAPRYAPDL